jgi:hypothetical protein
MHMPRPRTALRYRRQMNAPGRAWFVRDASPCHQRCVGRRLSTSTHASGCHLANHGTMAGFIRMSPGTALMNRGGGAWLPEYS